MADGPKPGPQTSLLPPVPHYRLTLPSFRPPGFREPPGFGAYPDLLFTPLTLRPLELPAEVTFRVRIAAQAPPGFQPVPAEAEPGWLKIIDELQPPAPPKPPPTPPKPVIRHVFIQVVPGTQRVYHFPVGDNDALRSREQGLTGAVQVTLQLHDDDKAGPEIAIAVQGAWVVAMYDPNQPTQQPFWLKTARQVQGVVQLSYVWEKFKGTNVQPQLAAQLAAGGAWGYDHKENRWVVGRQFGAAVGGAFNYVLNDQHSIGLGVMVGPSKTKDGWLVDAGVQAQWVVTFADVADWLRKLGIK